MQTLSAKKYNDYMTAKWNRDWNQAKCEGRDWSCMPQLAFYISEKKSGYWSFNDKTAYWAKTKQESITNFSNRITY